MSPLTIHQFTTCVTRFSRSSADLCANCHPVTTQNNEGTTRFAGSWFPHIEPLKTPKWQSHAHNYPLQVYKHSPPVYIRYTDPRVTYPQVFPDLPEGCDRRKTTWNGTCGGHHFQRYGTRLSTSVESAPVRFCPGRPHESQGSGRFSVFAGGSER